MCFINTPVRASHCLVFLFPAVLVGHVTLRLLKPACDLDEAWEQEDLETAALRTILLLHNHTVPQREVKTSGEQMASSFTCFLGSKAYKMYLIWDSVLMNQSLNIWVVYKGNETRPTY